MFESQRFEIQLTFIRRSMQWRPSIELLHIDVGIVINENSDDIQTTWVLNELKSKLSKSLYWICEAIIYRSQDSKYWAITLNFRGSM